MDRAGPSAEPEGRHLASAVTSHYAQWLAGGGALILAAALLAWQSLRFEYSIELIEKPALWLAAGLFAAGLVYAVCLPRLISRSLDRPGPSLAITVGILFGAGLLARLVLFTSEPILEDDFYRYLWDGAATSSGQNPFATAPAAVADAATLPPDAAKILDRVGYADLRTIYPPVAQLAFATAHRIDPWSLTAWRSVVLVLDVTTLGILLLLLKEAGRSPLWAALYWWNPLLIFSLFNGAHMDVIVLPPLLLALLLASRGRSVLASASLAVAIGAKIWPILLLPLILRPALTAPARLFAAAAVLLGLLALQAWPILAAGMDETSGFVAYAQSWQRNSALFPLVETIMSAIVGSELAGPVSRVGLALICAAVAVAVAWRPYTTTNGLMIRAALVVTTLLLTAPAQYPWYLVWLVPFLAFLPLSGLLLLTAMLPLYYTAFHLAPRQQIDIYNGFVVWLVWLPVWALLARDLWRRRMAPFA